MGLIRNAIEQGRQAIESVRVLDGIGASSQLDVVIVGAGPAGFSASLAAKHHRLRSVTLEQDSLGGTVAHYPRGKIVMTAPAKLPLVGKFKFTSTTKEDLLRFLEDAERKTGLEINYGERLEEIVRAEGGFLVKSSRGQYSTRSVLLAIGRRGTPRKLGVPGEDLTKVTYRLIDPEQYRDRNVLIVGGGDSAIEAATSIADEPGSTVTLSYRSEAFSRAKEKNRMRAQELQAAGRLNVLMQSNVIDIGPDRVKLKQRGRPIDLQNDTVIVCAGGVLPTPFLKSIGIRVDTKYGKS